MTNLRTLQTQFQQYIEGENETIESHIITTDEARAEHRLAAYYNAYRARLIEALAFDFPTLAAFLGEDKFALLVINYIKKYPSSYSSVSWVGEHLTTFIKQQQSFPDQAFVSELSLFEWNQRLVFDQQDENTLFQLEDMAQISPEQWPNLSFQFISNIKSIDLHYNVASYWQAVNDQETPPDIIKENYPVRWLIWRQELNPHWRSLDVHEAWAYEQAQQGANFADICAGLTEWIDEQHVALQAAGFLKQWISDQLIIRVNH